MSTSPRPSFAMRGKEPLAAPGPAAPPSKLLAKAAPHAPAIPEPAEPQDIIPLPHVAWERFIVLHRAAVYSYLRARLFGPADAEDLAQEVFLRCYRAGMPGGEEWDQRGWLLGIARNVLREYIRREQRRKEIQWAELCLDLDELAATQGTEPPQGVVDLRECLDTLGPSARQALALKYEDDLSLSEIGGQLKRSEGAVKLLMFRSRQALRNCLDRKQEE